MSQSEEIELLYKKLLGLPYSNPGAGATQEVGNSKPFIQAGRIMNQTIPSGIVFPSQFDVPYSRIFKTITASSVTGFVVQDGSTYTSITLAYKGDTIVLDRSPDQWSVISKSTGVTLS